MSPYPTVHMVMMAHQKVAGIDVYFESGSSFSVQEFQICQGNILINSREL